MYDDRQNDPRWKSISYACKVRDSFTCVLCGTKGKEMETHHIIRWADNIKLRYVLGNLVTLCKGCHGHITGKEEQYEDQFRKIIAQKKISEINNSGKAINRKSQVVSERIKAVNKWRPNNPRLRL